MQTIEELPKISDQVPLYTNRVLRKAMNMLKVGESFLISAEQEQGARHTAWMHFHRRSKSTGEPLSNKVFTI